MRFLYSCLFYLILPFVYLRLLWRSRHLPAYRERMGERLGYYPFKLDKCLWVHAVSVGETIAAIPLIKALKANYPQFTILVTTMTPTGAARVKAAFGEEVKHVYIPYDLPGAVQRFLNNMHPVVAIIMETELWPNLIAKCKANHIPVCLMNARLSEKSSNGYQRIAYLAREMMQDLSVIAATGQSDADRFIHLGAVKNKVSITGNIKFDLELPSDLTEKSSKLRTFLGNERFIWIAASTHEGEEEIILEAHKKIREYDANALLILVPRHPDRFDAIAKQSEQIFKTQRRTTAQQCDTDTAVYLGDTMGELLLMYSVADVTFVGGSLIERGGHNILEPAALMKPVLSGPHLFNFAEISSLFFSQQALIKVNDAEQLAGELIRLIQHPNERKFLGERALKVVDANRGALAKQLKLIQGVI